MQEDVNSDLVPIIDIVKSIRKLSQLAEGYNTSTEFYNSMDKLTFQNSIELLINIGSASKNVSNEVKEKCPEVPWHVIKNFIEVREEDCTILNRAVIFDLIKDKLPYIAGALEDLTKN
ncbi:HepT-like ribonuclease domain-containing protein [Ilyobacter polytropus]|uniref:DUF86 domain-containing protein n=1 Tax=Ilyobacter polytropus (strain ATCC 51220 / DSM 2926 / LMG 16218 / CuHBu1) TaxID=572544 RepID=E3HDZ6_ILYPC|nr:hypothetical protein [Ilyobacter polytropus]ADO84608.1 hypothetical protein Ilyop_2859 [Ilyobacter polytropus DSM 2926]